MWKPRGGCATGGDQLDLSDPGYALLGTFYLAVLPSWLGLDTQDVAFSTWAITKAVLIFLGIPLLLGYLTRRVGVARRGRGVVRRRLRAADRPDCALGLLFTIIVLFCPAGIGDPRRAADGRANRVADARLLRGHVVRVVRDLPCGWVAV